MMHNVNLTGFGTGEVINYTKCGEPFWTSIRIQPIISDRMYGNTEVSHLLGRIERKSQDPALFSRLGNSRRESAGYEWMVKHTLYKDDSDGSDGSGHSYGGNSGNSNGEDGSGDDNIESQEGLAANFPLQKEQYHRENICALSESEGVVGQWSEETKTSSKGQIYNGSDKDNN